MYPKTYLAFPTNVLPRLYAYLGQILKKMNDVKIKKNNDDRKDPNASSNRQGIDQDVYEVTLHRVLQRSALIISGQITFVQAITHGLK